LPVFFRSVLSHVFDVCSHLCMAVGFFSLSAR
jgi:hypothetical protein